DDDIDVAVLDALDHLRVPAGAAHGILVPPHDAGVRELAACLLLDALGAGAEVVEPAGALGAGFGRDRPVIAAMANQLVPVLVKDEGNIAVRTFETVPAGAAHHDRRH